MANQGVFMRNDNGITPIKRSLQNLSFRHTTTTKYGQIIPMLALQMYPHEKIRVKMTNFLRTIPMIRPQLSRVKIVTRFIAVPNRITWFGFEEYIKSGIAEDSVDLTEPYIANFNSVASYVISATPHNDSHAKQVTSLNMSSFDTVVSLKAAMRSAISTSVTDLSLLGVGVDPEKNGANPSSPAQTFCRSVLVHSDGVHINSFSGYQFFPHELGDYFNAPLFVASLGRDVSGRFSAYKFAAYQMAYSFFYRRPNVQDKVDDYYEMSSMYSDQRFFELAGFYTFISNSNADPYSPINRPFSPLLTSPAAVAVGYTADGYVGLTPKSEVIPVGYALNPSAVLYSNGTKFSAVDNPDVDQTLVSWSNVEKFPLKSGANIVMQAIKLNDNGAPTFNDSFISLTRIRYANWQSDRFTTANPWPQRGMEAQIPVVGSLSLGLENLSVSFPEINASTDDTYVQQNVALESTLGKFNPSAPYVPPTPFALEVQASSGTGSYVLQFDTVENETAGGVFMTERSAHKHKFTVPSRELPLQGSATGSVSGLYVSPSSFRFAMQLQRIKEMSARTDDRYKSFMSMFYGSRVPDDRLDRPTFIGGMVQELGVSEIQQNVGTDDSPLGSLAGRGLSAKKSNSISFYASEHTVLLGLVHIIPDTEYIGGLDRTDHLTDPFDWAMPQFAGLSEQPIKNSELALQPSLFDDAVNPTNDAAFGYEPRYNELRAKHSYATGAFRDVMNYTGSREYYKPWLIIRSFGIQGSVKFQNDTPYGIDFLVPTLSPEFLSMRHTVDNSNFAVTDEDLMYPFMLDSYFDVRWTRVVPSRGVPRI